jgi:exonuclease 3'-5' domain-containing protein 1
MELAIRTFTRKFVNGLSKRIERDLSLTSSEANTWRLVKEKGLKLFAPEREGGYGVFNKRPRMEIGSRIASRLCNICLSSGSTISLDSEPPRDDKVEEATKERVRLSQTASYNPKEREEHLGRRAGCGDFGGEMV